MQNNKNFHYKVLMLIFSMFFYAIVPGMVSVLFPILFKNAGATDSIVGYLDNVKIITGTICLILLPKITNKIGIVYAAILSLISFMVPLAIFNFVDNHIVWIILMAFYGVGLIVFRTAVESTINFLVSDTNRGKAMSFVTLSMFLGIGSGPIIVKFIGSENYISYLIAIVASIISAFLFYSVKNCRAELNKVDKLNFFEHVKDLPLTFLSKFIVEFLCQSIYVFGVIYGVLNGYKSEDAGLFLTFFCLASYLFSIPIGWLVDKYRRPYFIMILGIFLSMSSLLTLPYFIVNKISAYILFFIFGIGATSITISALSILNNYYTRDKLLAANSAFSIAGSLGMLFSAFLTGIAMDYFGTDGFFIPMLIVWSIYMFTILIFPKRVFKKLKSKRE